MKISKEAKVGIMVTAAIIIFYVGFNYLKGIEVFSNKSSYYAVYDNIDGLTVSNPVIINGLNIGRVSRIELDQAGGNRIIVEIQVPSSLVVTDSTTALLINSDFLGSKAITLRVDKPGRVLLPGDTLLSEVDPSITELLRESAEPLATSINTTIRNINKILEEFAEGGDKISQMLESAKSATATVDEMVAENRRNVKVVSDNLALLSSELLIISKDIQPILEKVEIVADSMSQLRLNQTIDHLNATLVQLQAFSEQLNTSQGAIHQLMDDPALYDNLNRSAAALDTLLTDLKQNPKRYVHFSLFGRKRD